MRNGAFDSISAPVAVENSARDVDNSRPLGPSCKELVLLCGGRLAEAPVSVRDLRGRGRCRRDSEGDRWQAIGRVSETPVPSHLRHISA